MQNYVATLTRLDGLYTLASLTQYVGRTRKHSTASMISFSAGEEGGGGECYIRDLEKKVSFIGIIFTIINIQTQ